MEENNEAVVVREHTSRGGHRCRYVDYNVRRPEGLLINEQLFLSKVNVPQCVADVLTGLDQSWEQNEQSLLSNRGGSRLVAVLKE